MKREATSYFLSMYLLGVRIDALPRQAVREQLARFLVGDGQHIVITPNPEMLVLAYREPQFLQILNRGSLNLADGIGLLFAARALGGTIRERVTGVDLVHDLVHLAHRYGKRVYFFGGIPSWVAEQAATELRRKFPEVSIHADGGGEILHQNGVWQIHPETIRRIQSHAPEILVVALGHGKQERFIHDYLPQLPSVKIAIGVGGALDYYAGRMRRAPKFMRSIGFEWLWRLAHEPRRFRRILNAIIVFPFLVAYSRFSRRTELNSNYE